MTPADDLQPVWPHDGNFRQADVLLPKHSAFSPPLHPPPPPRRCSQKHGRGLADILSAEKMFSRRKAPLGKTPPRVFFPIQCQIVRCVSSETSEVSCSTTLRNSLAPCLGFSDFCPISNRSFGDVPIPHLSPSRVDRLVEDINR